MERFNYPSLEAARAESAEILQLIEAESYGWHRDQQEKYEAMEAEIQTIG